MARFMAQRMVLCFPTIWKSLGILLFFEPKPNGSSIRRYSFYSFFCFDRDYFLIYSLTLSILCFSRKKIARSLYKNLIQKLQANLMFLDRFRFFRWHSFIRSLTSHVRDLCWVGPRRVTSPGRKKSCHARDEAWGFVSRESHHSAKITW